MSHVFYWLACSASSAARLALVAQQARLTICFWIPRVAPISISFLEAPLPTAILLLGRAQRAVALKVNTRRAVGRR